MDDHEVQRIAAAAHQLRPDWPVSSLLTIIRKNLIERPRRDVAVALAWVACEANTANPARVLESGPWWLAAGVDGKTTGVREEFDPVTFCDVCNKPERRHAGSDHPFVSVLDHVRRLNDDDTTGRESAREYARQAIGDAKAEREPVAAPEPVAANPNVDRLRAVIADDDTHHTQATADAKAAPEQEIAS